MTDQGRGFEQDSGGDPAQAFEALRLTVERLAREVGGEMTVIRKGVEAAFEQFDKFQQPPDYSQEMMQLAKHSMNVGKKLEALGKSPAMAVTPTDYVRIIEKAGHGLIENSERVLEQRGNALERVRADMTETIRSARQRREQNQWLGVAGMAGAMMGVLLTLFLPRVLPGSVDVAVASTVMSADRWDAGISLMKSASPGGWNSLVDASNLVRDNRAALTSCAEAAAKAKKDQSCTITVSAPAQP